MHQPGGRPPEGLVEVKTGEDTPGASAGGHTNLHVAASDGQSDVVAVLLSSGGASVDATANDGLTALLAATQHGHTDVIRALCAAGADADLGGVRGVRPLHLAAAEGHLESAEILLEAGADVNARTDSGYTPLEFAALHNRLALAAVLCSFGATHGDALEVAEARCHEEMATWLRDTSEWSTPLHYLHVIKPERARAMLRDGADPHAALGPGKPTPALLAQAMADRGEAPEGSAAWLVCRAAAPWSTHTHELFAYPVRRRAVDVLRLGYLLSRLDCFEHSEEALMDAWRLHVMPHAVNTSSS